MLNNKPDAVHHVAAGAMMPPDPFIKLSAEPVRDWPHTLMNWIAWHELIRLGVLIIIIYIITRILLVLIEHYRRRATAAIRDDVHLAPTAKRIDTLCAILRNVVVVLIFAVTTVMLLGEFGINLAPLIAGASVAGVAIGFGAQSLVKDLFYGFFILLENQFAIGDIVQIGDATGQIERMSLRAVRMRDQDGRVHIIPNGEASKVIVYTQGWGAMNLNFEVVHKTNLDQLFEIIDTVNKTFYEQHKSLCLEPPKNLGVNALSTTGIAITIVGKTLPQKQWEVARSYRKALKDAFDQHGIEMPMAAPAAPPPPTG